MATYKVTTDRPNIPAAVFAATDLIDLGDQIATYLARHRLLHRGVPYDAQIGGDRGAIHQPGLLTRPVTFHITQEH